MSVPFRSFDKGYNSGIEDAQNTVLRTLPEWQDFSARHGSHDPPAEIDFSADMLICVHAGTKNSGGHGVEVKDVAETEEALTVRYETTAPGGGMVTMALTQPYHIVAVPSSAKPVRFEGRQAPPPARPAKFMLTFEASANKSDVMARIEALDMVAGTSLLGGVGIGIVDVTGDVGAAQAALQAVEGVSTVEQDG